MRTRPRQVAAFTLVEMIAVMVILGVLAAAIIPRVAGNAARQAEVESRNVQRLISVAAERTSLWTQPVAIDFDDGRLRLLAVKTGESTAASSGRGEWVADPLVEPVQLERAKMRRVMLDGQALSPTRWRATFTPSQPRPALELELGTAEQADGWVIELPGESTAARRRSSVAPGRADAQTTIDLDDTGKGATPW